jgi:hypothetical protein
VDKQELRSETSWEFEVVGGELWVWGGSISGYGSIRNIE